LFIKITSLSSIVIFINTVHIAYTRFESHAEQIGILRIRVFSRYSTIQQLKTTSSTKLELVSRDLILSKILRNELFM